METWNDILTIALNNFPNASLGEDSDGQIVIYTNYYPGSREKTRDYTGGRKEYEDRDA